MAPTSFDIGFSLNPCPRKLGAPQHQQQRPCWFVGAHFKTAGDQTERFVRDGVWKMDKWDAPAHDRYVRQVKSMRPGDRIAIKSTYVRKTGINFDNKGKLVSVMAIKAVGEITENPEDGHNVKVRWTRLNPRREWYFYTNQHTVWEVTPGSGAIPWAAEALIEFAFNNKPQTYKRFVEGPWRDTYTDPWDGFIRRAKEYLSAGRHDEEEIKYKLKVGREYAKARELVLNGSDGWGDAIRTAKPQNLLYFMTKSSSMPGPVTIQVRPWVRSRRFGQRMAGHWLSALSCSAKTFRQV